MGWWGCFSNYVCLNDGHSMDKTIIQGENSPVTADGNELIKFRAYDGKILERVNTYKKSKPQKAKDDQQLHLAELKAIRSQQEDDEMWG